MAMHYSDRDRETNPTALPNVETFYLTETDAWTDDNEGTLPEGWYFWYCFPGCLPDSQPMGPYETEAAALAEARAEEDAI